MPLDDECPRCKMLEAQLAAQREHHQRLVTIMRGEINQLRKDVQALYEEEGREYRTDH